MSTNFNSSQARVTKAEVKSFSGRTYSIAAMIGGFEISHSLDQVGYRGHLKVLDSVGFLENFTMRGEETLDLEILGTDFQTKISFAAQIYKIDSVQMASTGDKLTYKLHFVSRISYEAAKKKVIMPFQEESAAYAAEQIFRRFFSELDTPTSLVGPLPYRVSAYGMKDDPQRNFYIQETEGKLKAIIPNLTPSEAMFFLTQRSYSTDSQSCSFRFFENYDGFHYVTDEFLIKRAIEDELLAQTERRRPKYLVDLIYIPNASLEPVDAEVQTRLIESISNDMRVDTSSDLMSGGYANKAIEIDLIRRDVIEKNFYYKDFLNYTNMNGQAVKLSEDVHTSEFIEETFNDNNAKRFMIFRDFGQSGDNPSTIRADQYYSEIISNKMFYKHHLGTTSVSVGVKGRLDIQAGKVVRITVSEFNIKKDKTYNQQLSGNYLVESVAHQLDDNTLRTRIKLIKYNWSQ